MLKYFRNHLVAKIGFLFFLASLGIVVFSYYISIYWVNLQKDDILDAHDAYFQYKLVESWGVDVDTALVSLELKNLHMQGMIYYLDGDHNCENDSLLFWSNVGKMVAASPQTRYENVQQTIQKRCKHLGHSHCGCLRTS